MSQGTLVQCDPAIRAIILKIDSRSANSFVLEDLDEGTLLVQENKVTALKQAINEELAHTQEDQGGDEEASESD